MGIGGTKVPLLPVHALAQSKAFLTASSIPK